MPDNDQSVKIQKQDKRDITGNEDEQAAEEIDTRSSEDDNVNKLIVKNTCIRSTKAQFVLHGNQNKMVQSHEKNDIGRQIYYGALMNKVEIKDEASTQSASHHYGGRGEI